MNIHCKCINTKSWILPLLISPGFKTHQLLTLELDGWNLEYNDTTIELDALAFDPTLFERTQWSYCSHSLKARAIIPNDRIVFKRLKTFGDKYKHINSSK